MFVGVGDTDGAGDVCGFCAAHTGRQRGRRPHDVDGDASGGRRWNDGNEDDGTNAMVERVTGTVGHSYLLRRWRGGLEETEIEEVLSWRCKNFFFALRK